MSNVIRMTSLEMLKHEIRRLAEDTKELEQRLRETRREIDVLIKCISILANKVSIYGFIPSVPTYEAEKVLKYFENLEKQT